MSSQAVYRMHGFNASDNCSCKQIVKLIGNEVYIYENHSFLESVYIDDDLKQMTFTMLPEKEAKDYLEQISDELEKICFNIITYTQVLTQQPVCELMMITDKSGNNIEMRDKCFLKDVLEICVKIDKKSFYDSVVNKNTPISEHKADYKELFYILHNPHKVIQFIALYDILINLICSAEEGAKQKRVRDFFGKNRQRYPFVKFHNSESNPKKSEDMFSYLRNSIAHSKEVGIEEFMKTTNVINDQIISWLLQVINDIISGEIDVG